MKNVKNSGKIFEQQFKASVPDYCLLHRLKDSAQAFNQSNLTSYTWNNPCDFFMFDSIAHILYCLELKSTKYKFMSFDDINSDTLQNKNRKMIHKHQILSLLKYAEYENVLAGFLFNFRDEENNMERTYYQNIIDFQDMCKNIGKASFNEMDLILHKAIKINGRKKRINYVWDINGLLKLQHK